MTFASSVAAAEQRLANHDLPLALVERAAIAARPEVTIVIAVSSSSRHLSETLASVSAQTYEEWQCVVVDDACHEPVWEYVKAAIGDDQRVVYARHGRPAGVAATLNTGLLHANGILVQFLEADDMLAPTAIETRVDALARFPDLSLVAGAYGAVEDCLEGLTFAQLQTWDLRRSVPNLDWIASEGSCPFPLLAPLLRSSVVRALHGLDEQRDAAGAAWDLWHRILRHGYQFAGAQVLAGVNRRYPIEAADLPQIADDLDRLRSFAELNESWVSVDPAAAVGPAAMPLSAARSHRQRIVRAARWAGIQATASPSGTDSDSPRCLIDENIRRFVGGSTVSAAHRDEVTDAARAGVVRGLGLASTIMPHVPGRLVGQIEVLASEIADELLDAETHEVSPSDVDRVDLVRRDDPDIAFLAETAADVTTMTTAVEHARDQGHTVAAIDLDTIKGDEGATAAWIRAGVPLISYNAVSLGRSRPRVAIARRPAGPVTLDLLDKIATAGGITRFLAEPRRVVELELDPSFSAELGEVQAREAPNLVASEKPTDRASWSGSPFSVVLRHEEDSVDVESTRKLLDLKDHHRGETVVIVGNGPSLNDTDLDLLSDVPIFGVNSLFLAGDKLPVPPTYYVVEDTMVFKENTRAIKDFKVGTRFFPHLYREHFERGEIDESTIFFRMNQGFYGKNTGTFCHPRFSVDATQRVHCGQSVTIINLQLAYWLGFSKVVLIGMDFSYVVPKDSIVTGSRVLSMGDDPNHFHPDYFGKGKTWKDPHLDRVLANYALAKEMYEADGRLIVNATVGGKLELFERVELATAIA